MAGSFYYYDSMILLSDIGEFVKCGVLCRCNFDQWMYLIRILL